MAEKKSYYNKKGELNPKVEYKPKRGPLSKLMSEDEKASAGIHELSYDFGCRITRLFQRGPGGRVPVSRIIGVSNNQ